MFVKIKKQDNKTFVLKIKNKIIKIPYSSGSWREIKRERETINLVKNDYHFSSYLLSYSHFLGCSVVKYIHTNRIEDNLIKKYFQKCFLNRLEWRFSEINNLLESRILLEFIKDNLSDDYKFWFNYLNEIELPEASCHGDFYKNNILRDKEKFYFIDWSNYRTRGCRYYDLIDYYIVSNDNLWFKNFKRLFFSDQRLLAKIKINNSYLIGYCLWKVSKELRELETFDKISQAKIRKYKDILIATKVMINKYGRKNK